MLSIECKVCGCNAVQNTQSFFVLWWELDKSVHDPCIVCNSACMEKAAALHRSSHSGACILKTRAPSSVINQKAVGAFDKSFGRGWNGAARKQLLAILQVTENIPDAGSGLTIVSSDTPMSVSVPAQAIQRLGPGGI